MNELNIFFYSSAGPIKTPVGACATAVESIELGNILLNLHFNPFLTFHLFVD